MLIKFLVHEGGFHQRLTVVECAVHLKGCDVLSQRSELLLLNFAHLAFRIKYINMDSFHTEETVGYGAARIPRSGNQYVHLLLALFPDEIAQQTRHKTAAHILKGKRRSMKQLKGIDILRHLHQRHIKTQRVIHNLFQRICRNILSKESIRHPVGYLLKAKRVNAVVKILRQRFDGKGHEKSFVSGKPFHYGLFQSSIGRLFVSTVIFHNSFINSFINSSSFIMP